MVLEQRWLVDLVDHNRHSLRELDYGPDGEARHWLSLTALAALANCPNLESLDLPHSGARVSRLLMSLVSHLLLCHMEVMQITRSFLVVLSGLFQGYPAAQSGTTSSSTARCRGS